MFRSLIRSLWVIGVFGVFGMVAGGAIGYFSVAHFSRASPKEKVSAAQAALWDYLGDEYGSAKWRYLAEVPRWLGVPVLQMPFDMIYLQELIVKARPDYIIETGTYKGGSALYFATILDQLQPNGKVITIDIKDIAVEHVADFERLKGLPVYNRLVRFFHGSSTDADIVKKVYDEVSGGRVFVTLDSTHEAGHVLNELKAYAPLVSIGSYIVVQDAHVDRRMEDVNEKPIRAIKEFLREHPEFEMDHSRPLFGLSKLQDGVLRRVR